MISQRDIARNSRCIFWDTREAMGGENSIVDWANANPSRANKDYIHLTHSGGAVEFQSAPLLSMTFASRLINGGMDTISFVTPSFQSTDLVISTLSRTDKKELFNDVTLYCNGI